MQPTRANILQAFKWLMKDLVGGDKLFVYFSGHGGTLRDTTGRERGGMCQTICPIDGPAIPDYVLYKMLVKPLPQNVTLHSLFDSCHSGTVMNLPFNARLTPSGVFVDWDREYPNEKICARVSTD